MSKCNEYHLIQMGGPQSKRFAAASVCNEREHIILIFLFIPLPFHSAGKWNMQSLLAAGRDSPGTSQSKQN